MLDTYIQAEDSKCLTPFIDQSLLEIITKKEILEAISLLPNGIKTNHDALAETIENNVRVKIIKESLIDPVYFEKMSKLLQEIIKERKAKAIAYEEYLKKIVELAKNVCNISRNDLPSSIQTNAQQALYHNLEKDEKLAISVDEAVQASKMADWRGNIVKERIIKKAIYNVLREKPPAYKIVSDEAEVERIFEIIKEQHEY